jgi:CelD/BcsL family acetyltransferase involved in cellulose biosynthesis
MEVQAERLGDLQKVLAGIFTPSTVAGLAVAGGIVAVGWIEKLPM